MAAPRYKPLGDQRTRKDVATASRHHLLDQKYASQTIDQIQGLEKLLLVVGMQSKLVLKLVVRSKKRSTF